MKRILFLTLMLVLLPCSVWGATVYTKNISGTVYYDTTATSCNDVTNSDTSGDLEAALTAAGASGTLNICAGTYTNTEIDSDNTLDFTANGQTVQGVGTAVLSVDNTAEFHILVNGRTNAVIDNLTLVYTDGATEGSGAAIRLRGTDSATSAEIKNCTIYGFADNADVNEQPRGIAITEEVTLNGDGIHDNEIYNLHKGIDIYGDAAATPTGSIKNNDIHDGTLGTVNVRDGIIVSSDTARSFSGLIIENNTFANWPDQSIDVLHANDIIVRNNFIDGTGSESGGDGDGIKMADPSVATSGQKCYNNIIINVDTAGILAGRMGGDIYNNTIYNCGEYGIIQNANNADNDLNIQNNIISTCGTSGDQALIFYYANKVATLNNNIYHSPGANIARVDSTNYTDWATYQAAVTPDDANSINSDPLLVNAGGTSAADYKLAQNSPGIDAGGSLMHTTNTVTVDYDNQCRPKNYKYDIGAYEYDDGTDSDCFIDDTYYTICTTGCDQSEVEDTLDAYDLGSGDTMFALSNITESDQISWLTGDSGDATADVTLDLNDYTLTGPSGSYLISVGSSVDYITIKNGALNVGGGLSAYSTGCSNIELSDLDVTLTGTSTWFVQVSQGSGESLSILDIYNNTIRGRTDANWNSGVWLVGDIDDIDIYNNMLIDILQGVYVSDSFNNYPTNLDIYNNTVHSVVSALKSLTTGVLFFQNVEDTNDGTTIKNNIFSDLNYGVSDDPGNAGDPALGYNLYYSNNTGDCDACTKGTGHISGSDPQFADATGTDTSDYYLLVTSPAINGGDREAYDDGVTTDRIGTARQGIMDVGAYELDANSFTIRNRSGSDNNNGVSSAWKTLKSTELLPGAYVLFRERYKGNLTIPESGTSSNRIYLDFLGNQHKGDLTINGNYVEVLRRR